MRLPFFGFIQLLYKEIAGKIIDDEKTVCNLLLLFYFITYFFFFNYNIVACSQPFQRFYITVFLMLHEKADAVSAFSATKTFINFFGRRNSKRGRFFVVE